MCVLNCCTCSCGILRGIADLGISNAVARSAFVNQVSEDLCVGCELCIEYCQFDALTMDNIAHLDANRCLGCGVCVPCCPDGALGLIRRPIQEIEPTPVNEIAWLKERAAARGLNLGSVL